MGRSDVTGQRFGRLVVLEMVYVDGQQSRCRSRCDCGTEVTRLLHNMRSGTTASCGCLALESVRSKNLKHGKRNTPEYRIFRGMKQRCENPKSRSFPSYGGRGIQVLYADFEQFFADVGPRPDGACIDREDNERHYEPGNCRWVTPSVNLMNTRKSRIWTINGVEYGSSTEAARVLGLEQATIWRRCTGYVEDGRTYPPRPGWSSRLKYDLTKSEDESK